MKKLKERLLSVEETITEERAELVATTGAALHDTA